MLNIVDRSIDAPRLVREIQKAFTAARGPPRVLRMDNGPDFISHVLRDFCDGRVGLDYIPPGTPWNNGTAESFYSRTRRECLNRNHWTCLLEAQVGIGDYKHDHNTRYRHSSLGYLTPDEYAAQCRHTHTPVACEID